MTNTNELRMAKEIEELKAEINARGKILDAIADNFGGNIHCWMNVADMDWRGRLREFANDAELHTIGRKEWKGNSGNGITLYLIEDFAVAYFDDAVELWERADDEHSMFYVIAQGAGPHRTCIHIMHLTAWIQHLAEACLPVQVIDGQFIEGDGE